MKTVRIIGSIFFIAGLVLIGSETSFKLAIGIYLVIFGQNFIKNYYLETLFRNTVVKHIVNKEDENV